MKYYHVSTDIYHSGFFTPRIPSENIRMNGEDGDTPRICVSTSIEGCFSSMPCGGSRLDVLAENQKGYFKVIEIDTEKVGISDEDILTSSFLYESGKVSDAEVTNEHWITKGFSVSEENMYIILLQSWEEEIHDLIPYHIMEIAEEKFDGDYFQAYYETMKEDFIPCVNSIENIQFQKGNICTEQECFEHPYIDNDMEIMDLNSRLDKSKIVSCHGSDFLIKGEILSIEELAKTHLGSPW